MYWFGVISITNTSGWVILSGTKDYWFTVVEVHRPVSLDTAL